jgi:hypothetical protein
MVKRFILTLLVSALVWVPLFIKAVQGIGDATAALIAVSFITIMLAVPACGEGRYSRPIGVALIVSTFAPWVIWMWIWALN